MTKTFTLATILFLNVPFLVQGQTTPQEQYPKETLKGVNTQYLEVRPLISGDGQTLFYSRRFYPDNFQGVRDFQDIYVSTYDSTTNTWSAGENIGKTLNNKRRNAVASVNADGTEGIFFNTYSRGDDAPLVRSRKTEKGWTKPVPVKIQNYINTNDFADYHLDYKHNVLFSAIEADQGTFGEQDIYISMPNGVGGWKEPLNLGEVINTPASEFSPFLAADGRSLFFASYGHEGLGGSDIYMSVRLDDTWLRWSKPVNLGPAVNTNQDESYFSLTDDFKYLYYTSHDTRQTDRDIVRVELPEDFTAINGPLLVKLDSAAIKNIMLSGNYKVDQLGARRNFQGVSFEGWPEETETVAVTTETAPANTTENPQSTTTTPAIAETEETPSAEPTTTTATTAPTKAGRYANFRPVEEVTNLSPEAEELKRYLQQQLPDLNLLVNQQGDVVEFKLAQNLQYDFNSIYVASEYLSRLRKIGNILKEKENLQVQLIGHTDNVGSEEENQRVATQRVDNLEQYFKRRGIAESRIDVLGVSSNEPLAENDTEEARGQNRRVETIIRMMR